MAITIDSFLAALRMSESGSFAGNYTAHTNDPGHTASGAYQYVDGTWNHYGGYAHAWQAPKSVQDARARQDVTARLVLYGGDWERVAAAHFAGSGWVAKHPDKSTWDQNPVPGSNNPTVRAYVNKVIKNAGGKQAIAAGASSGGVSGNSATGGAAAASGRPNDWISALDSILNPKPPHDDGLFGTGIGPALSSAPKDIAYVVQLVAARTGLAVVGMIALTAGLALVVGPELLQHPGLLAPVAPEAAAVAATVGSDEFERTKTARHGQKVPGGDGDEFH
jgi:Transglycosylase-like domain.